MHDEAKPLRDVRQMPGAICGDAHDEERTARCGTTTRRARLRRRACKLLERGGMCMTEGETKADRQSAVAQRMYTERLGCRPQRRPRKIDEDIRDHTAKRSPAVRRDDVPCARRGSAPRHHAQHAPRCLDRMLGGACPP